MAEIEASLTDGIGVSDEAEIDLEAYVKALFTRTCEAVRNRHEMSAEDREAFEAEAATFPAWLEDIGKIADKRLRRAAMEAVGVALALGFHHAGNGDVVRTLKAELNRERVKPAVAERRRDEFQELVHRLAKDLWDRKKSFKGNPTRTAKEICDAVRAALPTLAKPPEGYEKGDLSNPARRNQFIDLIRKRVERIQLPG